MFFWNYADSFNFVMVLPVIVRLAIIEKNNTAYYNVGRYIFVGTRQKVTYSII